METLLLIIISTNAKSELAIQQQLLFQFEIYLLLKVALKIIVTIGNTYLRLVNFGT